MYRGFGAGGHSEAGYFMTRSKDDGAGGFELGTRNCGRSMPVVERIVIHEARPMASRDARRSGRRFPPCVARHSSDRIPGVCNCTPPASHAGRHRTWPAGSRIRGDRTSGTPRPLCPLSLTDRSASSRSGNLGKRSSMRAKRRVCSGRLTLVRACVTAVATRSGFPAVETLRHHFRRLFGTTPTSCRRTFTRIRKSTDHLQIAEPVRRRTRLCCSTRSNRPQWRRRLRVAWTYNRPPSSFPFRHAHP